MMGENSKNTVQPEQETLLINKEEQPPCYENAEKMETTKFKPEKKTDFEPVELDCINPTAQFLKDFFQTDIMNHCEFLKTLKSLDEQDCYLLAHSCESLVRTTNGIPAQKKISPFYGVDGNNVEASDVGHVARADFQKHKSFPRNVFNIFKVYGSLNDLDGHDFNIYEYAFLNYHSNIPVYAAFLTFIIQVAIFLILVISNGVLYEQALNQNDMYIWIINIATTFFFVSQCFGEWKSAHTFHQACAGVIGENQSYNSRGNYIAQALKLLNVLANQVLTILVPIFNFYFILLSDSPNDALMNSLALFFIVELDDYIMIHWPGLKLEDYLAINAHDFIMVETKPSDLIVNKEGQGNYENGQKLYVQVQEDANTITIYSRQNMSYYDKTVYRFSGKQAPEFLKMASEFSCLQNFKDIHD